MSMPIFIHVMKTGDVWVACDQDFTPTGTIAATFRVNSGAAAQKVGTITGAGSPNYLCSNGTGKQGKEIW